MKGCIYYAAVALGLAGCYTAEYPDQYNCSAAAPACPGGLECNGSKCVPTGTTDASLPDQAGPDLGGDLAPVEGGPHPDGAVAQVSTFAGTTKGYKDGPALLAQFDWPTGIAVDGKGDIYIADSQNHRVRKISGGEVSTLAGSGTAGFADGVAATAQFMEPYGIAVNSAGDMVYVADRHNHRVRLIEGGIVATFAGDGQAGFTNGIANQSRLNQPCGVAVDSGGIVYVADRDNHAIRVIEGGKLSTFAGTGLPGKTDGDAQSAQFMTPYGVAVGTGNQIYVADTGNARIRIISNGQVGTLAGGATPGFADGPADTALFNEPTGIFARTGQIFIADRNNHRIRLFSGGQVTTVAGTGQTGLQNGPADQATFDLPNGVAIDKGTGEIYIADRLNDVIRAISP